MIGFTNSVTATLNDRTERLREVAAVESLVRSERRAAKEAARLAAAMKAARERKDEFTWEGRVHTHLLDRRRTGTASRANRVRARGVQTPRAFRVESRGPPVPAARWAGCTHMETGRLTSVKSVFSLCRYGIAR